MFGGLCEALEGVLVHGLLEVLALGVLGVLLPGVRVLRGNRDTGIRGTKGTGT